MRGIETGGFNPARLQTRVGRHQLLSSKNHCEAPLLLPDLSATRDAAPEGASRKELFGPSNHTKGQAANVFGTSILSCAGCFKC